MDVQELLQALECLIIDNSNLECDGDDVCAIENLTRVVRDLDEDMLALHFEGGSTVSIYVRKEN